jgi:uncharacterized membrane protein
MSELNWYYAKDGRRFGPISKTELLSLIHSGQLSASAPVWSPGLGDQWIGADAVEGLLFEPPPHLPGVPSVATQQPAPHRYAGEAPNAGRMRRAREALSGRWGLGVGSTLVLLLIIIPIAMIPVAGEFIVNWIVAPVLALGMCRLFLAIARGEPASIERLFSGHDRLGTVLLANLLTSLFTLLWMLLLIVPGIIAAYAYSQTNLIIAEDPNIEALEAIERSKHLMQGHKWEFFCLHVRFIGWSLLAGLTCGIGGLWLIPYMQTAAVFFYEDLKDQSSQ